MGNPIINIPPLNGLPTEQQVKSKNIIPSNLYIVRLGTRTDANSNIAINNNEIERLKIQSIPLKLNVDAQANWAVIPTIGRNNPFYQYTGGEDTVNFTIDWYSTDPLRQDVIYKCRWVESLSRSDGYKNPPPLVLLIWGDLYKFTTWIVQSAPYELSLFDKEYGVLPRQAYQRVTLKKVVGFNTTINQRRLYN